MRRVIAIALAGLAALSATSCSVDRRSDGFACGSNDDCSVGRTCDRGYCVLRFDACPSPCTACDLAARTCRIECSSARPCGNVTCPAGYDCSIRCNNASACSAIACGADQRCDVACSGANACGGITCGPQACDVTCTGAQACAAIDCTSSCGCDVKCNAAAGCASSCPVSAGGERCTVDGLEGSLCDSTFGLACSTCF